jgi:hypothetical protein
MTVPVGVGAPCIGLTRNAESSKPIQGSGGRATKQTSNRPASRGHEAGAWRQTQRASSRGIKVKLGPSRRFAAAPAVARVPNRPDVPGDPSAVGSAADTT